MPRIIPPASVKDIANALSNTAPTWGPVVLGELLNLIRTVAKSKKPKTTLVNLARIAAHEAATDAALAAMKPSKKG